MTWVCASEMLTCLLISAHVFDAAYHMLYPPNRACLDPHCSQYDRAAQVRHDRPLVEPLTYPVVVYTRDLGPLPGWSTSLYCRSMC
jgi:hypothetical protein